MCIYSKTLVCRCKLEFIDYRYMLKNIFLGLLALVFVGAIIFLGARLLTPEDTWLCQNGTWVKHGNPSLPMPTGACESIPQTIPTGAPTSGAVLPNPASKNCLDKGGSLTILNETAGQLGICKFKDGSECEEWQFYRGQCKKGQYTKAETSHAYSGIITKVNNGYTFKDSSGVTYLLELPTNSPAPLNERLAAELKNKQTVTILATENPPLSKILLLRNFQEK